MKVSKVLGILCVGTLFNFQLVRERADRHHLRRRHPRPPQNLPRLAEDSRCPGDLTLYYPKWIPGEHAPDGPVIDLAGLKFFKPAARL